MNNSARLFEIINKNKLIALLSPKTAEECVKAYEILNPLGITLEIALRTPAALNGIKEVLKKYPEALLLAGTVMTKEQAELAIKAGAAGIVSPDYFPEIVDICCKKDIMCIPGGLSDCGKQLSQKASCYNLDITAFKEKYPYQWTYKLFPAITENNRFYEIGKTLQGPYKNIKIIYTGGISLNNLEEIVKFDPDGIFCGSALTKNINNPELMKKDAEKWVEIVNKY